LQTAATVSAITLALASTVARSYPMLLTLLFVGGVANSLAQPASNVYLTRLVPHHRLGLALGVQKSAIPAAALLGGLAVPVGLALTWRGVFVLAAVLGVVVARLLPHEAGHTTTSRSTSVQRPDVPTRLLVALALAVGLGSSASNALAMFTVRGGVEVNLDERFAALLLIAGSVGGIAVRMLAGARADRRPGRALTSMAALFAAAAACLAVMALQQRWWFAVATPLAYVTGFAWPGLFHLAVVRSNPTAPGAATGIAMTGGLAGAVVGPVLFGAIAQTWSFAAAWASGAALMASAALMILAVRPHIVERSPVPLAS
jgi:predicted MFS family arabinose efflux permease